jgi:hypothetical protein
VKILNLLFALPGWYLRLLFWLDDNINHWLEHIPLVGDTYSCYVGFHICQYIYRISEYESKLVDRAAEDNPPQFVITQWDLDEFDY